MKLHTDHELVAMALVGDNSAFEALVRRHQGLVRNWLRRLGNDPVRADDVAQETFVQVWRRLRDYRGEGEFRSWLLKIAYSQFLQHIRRQKRQSALLEQVEQLAVRDCSSANNEELPDLERLLSPLSVEEKACMLLCYSHGYSHVEVSELLGMPLGTVKSLIRRSTGRIRERFGIEV